MLDTSGGVLRSVIQRYKPKEAETSPLFADPAYVESDHNRLWQNCHLSKEDLDLGLTFDYTISLRVKQGGGGGGKGKNAMRELLNRTRHGGGPSVVFSRRWEFAMHGRGRAMRGLRLHGHSANWGRHRG